MNEDMEKRQLRVVEKKTTRQIHAISHAGGMLHKNDPSSSLSPLNSNVNAAFVFACPAAGHFDPDLPEPKHRQPCTEYTRGKKKRGAITPRLTTPVPSSPFFSLSLTGVNRERKNPGRIKIQGQANRNRQGLHSSTASSLVPCSPRSPEPPLASLSPVNHNRGPRYQARSGKLAR